MTTKNYPTKVERLEDVRILEITWQTGETVALPYDELRGYCPCAGCQGHMVRELRFRSPSSQVQALAVAPVGNYAISILWSDGHSTGIYKFDFLAGLTERTKARLEQEKRAASSEN